MYLSGPRLLLILGLLSLPLALEAAPYWKRVTNIMCIYALLAISFDFLANYVGLVYLGGAMFVGVGGYASAVLNVHAGLPVYMSIPLYFAIVTLMLPLLFARLIEALGILGGTNGIMGLAPLPVGLTENYIIIVAMLAALFGLRRLAAEDMGLVLTAIKDNDQSVRASGINVTHMRAVAVFIAAFIGCFGGAYLAHLYMWAGLSLFALDFSVIPIAAVAIGGGGTIFGAVVGCCILVPLSEFLRFFGSFRIVIYCVILTAIIVFKSEGLMNYISRKYQQFERWVKV
jgi:branched-chain amino acid transport system permease protein